MTPFRNPTDIFERRYNKNHASTRNVVERCFGVLKNRFRCVLGSRGLHYSPKKTTQIINACCAVHNMCIKYKCIENNMELLEAEIDNLSENIADEEIGAAVAIRRAIAINF